MTPVRVDRTKYLPPLLLELVEAAEAGGDLVPAVQAIVRKLGFDGFLYATASYHLRPNNDERIYYFTTLPRDWVIRYDQQAYVECDPRVLYSFESALPLVWDHARRARQESEDRRFPARCRRARRRQRRRVSRVCGLPGAHAGVAQPRGRRLIDAARREQIAASLGDIWLFGQCFHEIFVKGVIERGLAPHFEGAPLSPRERQCLQMAAHGMTGADIAFKLGITERGVTYHFANIVSKLGVLNRHEAIARALPRADPNGSVRVPPTRALTVARCVRGGPAGFVPQAPAGPPLTQRLAPSEGL